MDMDGLQYERNDDGGRQMQQYFRHEAQGTGIYEVDVEQQIHQPDARQHLNIGKKQQQHQSRDCADDDT